MPGWQGSREQTAVLQPVSAGNLFSLQREGTPNLAVSRVNYTAHLLQLQFQGYFLLCCNSSLHQAQQARPGLSLLMCLCTVMGPVPAAWNHLPIHPVSMQQWDKVWEYCPPQFTFSAHLHSFTYVPHDSGVSEITHSPYDQAANRTCNCFFFFFFFLFLPICLSRSHHTDSQ